jgi:Bacterial regulatory proteins, luxR family
VTDVTGQELDGRSGRGLGPRPTEPAQRRLHKDEKAWLELAAASIARGLRRAMVAEPAPSSAPMRGPGVVLLDGGRVVSATREIAAELYLSPHTVRDHVKALFEKVGVASRGELVHRVFAEHYAAPSH